ncbi:YopX family protein [Bacillus cereus]|nr:YopX family protein [Bacillus cereus]
MKEIKFKANDGTRWIYSECVSRDTEDGWWILDNENDSWVMCSEPKQCTCLMDKNGKDIYLGDVVRWTRVIYTDYSREEIEDTEIIEGTIDWLYSVLTLKTKEFVRLLLPHLVEDQNEFEVIGNGYDNPVVLKN